MILANGFEDVEAIATIDVLRRAGLEVVLATVNDELLTTTQSDISILAEQLLSDIDYKEFDFLIIPGGKAVFAVLDKLPIIDKIINYFVSEERLVSAICAAPHLVGKLGHLKNHEYTCFPTCETAIVGGKYLPEEGVVVSDNFITAKAMAYSIDFALAIIKKLLGEEKSTKVSLSVKGIEK